MESSPNENTEGRVGRRRRSEPTQGSGPNKLVYHVKSGPPPHKSQQRHTSLPLLSISLSLQPVTASSGFRANIMRKHFQQLCWTTRCRAARPPSAFVSFVALQSWALYCSLHFRVAVLVHRGPLFPNLDNAFRSMNNLIFWGV